jgi:hypothetical protein
MMVTSGIDIESGDRGLHNPAETYPGWLLVQANPATSFLAMELGNKWGTECFSSFIFIVGTTLQYVEHNFR